MTHSTHTLQSVIEQLTAEGHVSTEQQTQILSSAAVSTAKESTPWYIQVLVAIGAWLAAICFLPVVPLSFLFSITRFGAIAFNTLMLILGVVITLAAIGLRRATTESIFAINLALALSLLGQILLLSGIWLITERIPLTALAAIGLQIAILFVYPDRLHRFLSALAICGAILVLIGNWQLLNAIHPLLWILALGIVVFWENEAWIATTRYTDLLWPIGYALATALLAIPGFSLMQQSNVQIIDWRISALGILVVLLGWEYAILSRYGVQTKGLIVAGVLIGTLLVLLPTLPAPGIAAAILVLLTGFHRGNRILIGIAIASLVIFVIAFYYYLVLTLFWKSVILVSSGIICFVLRMIFMRSIWKAEATQ